MNANAKVTDFETGQSINTKLTPYSNCFTGASGDDNRASRFWSLTTCREQCRCEFLDLVINYLLIKELY